MSEAHFSLRGGSLFYRKLIVMQRRLSNRKIKKILQYLQEKLPEQPTAVEELYTPPKYMAATAKDLQKISDHMGYYLGLLESVRVSFVPKVKEQFICGGNGKIEKNVEDLDYPGLYQVVGVDHKNIMIVNNPGFYFKHYLAILAHECSHRYLYDHGVKSASFDNEIMTDLAAIYLGFGHLLLDGYGHCEWTNFYQKDKPTYSFTLGYINPSTTRRAILYSAKIRNWSRDDIFSKFRFYDRLYFKFNYFHYGIRFASKNL